MVNTLAAIYLFIISGYTVLESISVVAESDHTSKICVSARYIFCAVSGAIGLYISVRYVIFPLWLAPLIGQWFPPLTIPFEILVMMTAIVLSCWSRMVYRVVGDRRVR